MKKLLSLLLCLALLLALTPAAFADGELPEDEAPAEEEAYEEPAEEEPYEEPAEDEPAEEPDQAPAEETAPEEPLEDDGPEYGVEPEEEAAKREQAQQQAQAEAEEPIDEAQPQADAAVWVSFVCDPQEAEVTVYDALPLPSGGWNRICTATGGGCLLAPGDYVYDAVCDGYYSDVKISFSVPAQDAAQPELSVPILLFPVDGGLSAEEGDTYLPKRKIPPEPLVVLPVMPDPSREAPTVFRQTDSRWALTLYPYSVGDEACTIAVGGCGLLALTNAVYYLNGIFVEPAFAAEFSARADCHLDGGTSWDFYRAFAESYGAACGIQYAGEVNSYSELKNMLLRGCTAICSVPGHIMAIVDYDESMGRFLLLDSSPDELRATEAGYVWISEQELCAMPSKTYEVNGLTPRFVILRAAGLLDVDGLLDGELQETLGPYGTFDVWVDGEKVANDQAEYSALLPRGASYRIDDIRAKGAHRYYGVHSGALEGSVRSDAAAEILLCFGTRDFVTEPDGEPASAETTPAVCARWAGGVIGPALTLPLPKA